MAAKEKIELNPKLEKFREEIPPLPDPTKILDELVTRPKIHPGCLYSTDKAHFLLQRLCILLSGTRSTHLYNGWESLGIKLGFEPEILTVIRYNFHNQDPAYYIFLAYSQNKDATLEKIFFALYEIERYDILLQIKDLACDAHKSILKKFHSGEDKEVIIPDTIPKCPLVLENLNRLIQPQLRAEEPCEDTETKVLKVNSNKKCYTKTIFLTYTSDADDIVKELLPILRKPIDGSRLGVLVLHEQRHKLSLCPDEFIPKWFEKIDYVCPIITRRYLWQIQNHGADKKFSPLENPDHKYVKYIYRLMNSHYTNNGCRNTKVRCIIPDKMSQNVLKHPIMNQSIFQVWLKSSEINTLIKLILDLQK